MVQSYGFIFIPPNFSMKSLQVSEILPIFAAEKMEKKKYKYQTQIDELTALDCIVRRELR